MFFRTPTFSFCSKFTPLSLLVFSNHFFFCMVIMHKRILDLRGSEGTDSTGSACHLLVAGLFCSKRLAACRSEGGSNAREQEGCGDGGCGEEHGGCAIMLHNEAACNGTQALPQLPVACRKQPLLAHARTHAFVFLARGWLGGRGQEFKCACAIPRLQGKEAGGGN